MQLNILYIHQHFKTPSEGGVTRSYEVGQALVQSGHQVTFITSWNKSFKETKIIDGITVIYLPVAYKNKFSFIRRVISFLLFKNLALKTGKSLKKPDVIIAISTPLTVGLLGHRLAKHFQIPWLFEIWDLWPEVPIQLGIIKSSILKKELYKIEKKLYQSANKIIALSPMSLDYTEHLFPKKSVFIPNFSNNTRFQPNLPSKRLNKKFTIGYFGAVSIANGLDSFIDLAHYANDNNLSDFDFIVVGEGQSKKQLELETKQLSNIKFYPIQEKDKVANMIMTCDASYVSFLNHPIMQSCSPNKFFDGLAAGRLIITNTVGWIADLVEQHKCGFFASNPEDFFKQITLYVNSESELQKAQKNAKQLALDKFDKDKLIQKLEGSILACI